MSVCVCIKSLDNIISPLTGSSENMSGASEAAQRFPAAACYWEKTVLCFLLVDSLAAGRLPAVHWYKVLECVCPLCNE